MTGPETLTPPAEPGAGPLVVKIGGSTLGAHDTTLEDLVHLYRQGTLPVVVHGGGKVISRWMERTGSLPRFVRGLRVTDPATLEVVVAVLTGLVNKDLVAQLQARGVRAVGVSGADGGLFQARVMEPELGRVGEVVRVDPAPVLALLSRGFLPVVAPVALAVDEEGRPEGGLLNINGDTAAGHLARALSASRLVFLTDVEGVLDASRRVIPHLPPARARAMVERGIATGGMIPKIQACLTALERVPVAHILDGRRPHALLECLAGREMGTRISPAW